MVDRNLFLRDFAVAAILKNEGHYLKEWLDYHLLAGVDHFYLYDNDSTDDYAEIIAPYVAAGLVTSKPFPGGSAQYAAYNDAVQSYRFECRYMAIIDLDEFICPRTTTASISAAIDEILAAFPDASAVSINWQMFGSNGHEAADYSRGVLERFTRRAPTDWVVPIPKRDIPGGNAQVKTVANPRRISLFANAHCPTFFAGYHSVNERGGLVNSYCNNPVTADKLAINHYNVKSRAEHIEKISKGRPDKGGLATELADKGANCIDSTWFDLYDRNEVFDDGILRYRAARAEKFAIESDEQRLQRVQGALTKNLSQFAAGKAADLETALTCRAVSSYLCGRRPNDERLQIFEEASLAAVVKSLDGLKFADAQLFISELPNLLASKSPIVEELRGAAVEVVSQMMNFMRLNDYWKDYTDLEHLRRLLKIFRR